jgi:hypothetical protein
MKCVFGVQLAFRRIIAVGAQRENVIGSMPPTSQLYIARYDELVDGHEKVIDVSKVDVSMDGIELQDREFISAIQDRRDPNASVAQIQLAIRILDRVEKLLASN